MKSLKYALPLLVRQTLMVLSNHAWVWVKSYGRPSGAYSYAFLLFFPRFLKILLHMMLDWVICSVANTFLNEIVANNLPLNPFWRTDGGLFWYFRCPKERLWFAFQQQVHSFPLYFANSD